MRRFVPLVTLAALVAAPTLAIGGQNGQTSAFATMTRHYEAIRQALLHDTTKDIAAHAKAIAAEAAALTARFDAAKANVSADKTSECTALLPEVERTANALADAADLESARAAFGDLSKPMVRYREMAGGERPMVVYCPMAKKSWLQPEGDIGNPYYGQKMARCGEVVSK